MKALTLKNKILELRGEQMLELVDINGQFMLAECGDDDWSLSLPCGTITIRFNNIFVSGTDVYLCREEPDEEGKHHIFAVLDANKWDIYGGEE